MSAYPQPTHLIFGMSHTVFFGQKISHEKLGVVWGVKTHKTHFPFFAFPLLVIPYKLINGNFAAILNALFFLQFGLLLRDTCGKFHIQPFSIVN